MKKLLGIILSVILALTMIMQVAAFKSVPVKGITLKSTSITLEVGKTYNLNPTLSPANTTQRNISYIVANKRVATIDSKGKITAVGAGQTTIKVLTSSKNVYTKCTVIVTQPKPYEFTIFRTYWINLNENTDPGIQYLNKKFNIKIHILSSTYEAWVSKYTIYVASGRIPDLSVTTGPGTLNFNEWGRLGYYLDLTKLYKQYCPNTQKWVSDDIINAHKIDGKLYGIPRPSISDSTFCIRQDWLDKLGIPMPKTLDQLTAAVKAFRDKDPDGDKKDNTYGYVTEDTLNTMGIVYGAFGCSVTPITTDGSINWISNGKGGLMSAIEAPGMKDAVKYIAKLYQDKILDPEWMLTKSQAMVDKVHTGKVGFSPTSFQAMISDTESKIKANDPSVKMAILDGVTGPSGQKYVRPMQKGFYMVSSLSKKVKNPVKILQFVDYLMSPEGEALTRYGIEGLTYKKVNGKIELISDAVTKYGYEQGHPFRQIMQPTSIAIPGDDPRIPSLIEAAQVLYKGPFYPAPTIQAPSQKKVLTQQGADFVKRSITEMVTGKGDIDQQWSNFIAKWKQTGGDELTKEINYIYAKNK